MTDQELIETYFSPPEGAHWRWSDCGDYVEQMDEHETRFNTLAHRQRVREIMEQVLLEKLSLPAFGDLLLLLRESKDLAGLWLLEDSRPHPIDAAHANRLIDALLVPISLNGTVDHVQGHWSSQSQAATKLKALQQKSPEVIKHLTSTGLESAPEAAELDLELSAQVSSLLNGLGEDSEFGGVAKLAKRLLGLVHLPKTVNDPQDLPLGGFSDISNTGQIDRLLLSELAYDDDILMRRIAMREALYLRRESPPLPQSETCQVLIDSTVRMWGLPRVFGLSVALALALRAGRKPGKSGGRDLHFFHTDDVFSEPIDITTAEGLRSHLAHLDIAHLPNEALQVLLDSDTSSESFLVTHADVFADADFTANLDIPEHHTLYVGTVDHDGAFALWQLGRKSRQRLREGRLDLEILVPTENLSASRPPDSKWPVFMLTYPYPIRMVGSMKTFAKGHPSIQFGVNDRCETFSRVVDQPGLIFHGFVPEGKVIGPIYDHPQNCFRFVIVPAREPAVFCTFDLEARTCRMVTSRLTLDPDKLDGGEWALGRWVIQERDHFKAFDPESGLPLAEATFAGGDLPRLYRRGLIGCSQMPERFFMIRFGEDELRFERVPIPDGNILLRRSSDGELFMVTADGSSIYRVDDPNERAPLNATRGHYWIDEVPDGYGTRNRYVDLQTMEIKGLPPRPHFPNLSGKTALEAKHIGRVCAWGRRLVIVTDRGVRFSLMKTKSGTLIWDRIPKAVVFEENCPVLKTRNTPDYWGRKLRVVRFPVGSEAWIDIRGFIHLRSHDLKIPEITLTFERPVSAWTTSGLLVGPNIVGEPRGTVSDVLAAVANFTGRLVPA